MFAPGLVTGMFARSPGLHDWNTVDLAKCMEQNQGILKACCCLPKFSLHLDEARASTCRTLLAVDTKTGKLNSAHVAFSDIFAMSRVKEGMRQRKLVEARHAGGQEPLGGGG